MHVEANAVLGRLEQSEQAGKELQPFQDLHLALREDARARQYKEDAAEHAALLVAVR
jgi:hypothetical protein